MVGKEKRRVVSELFSLSSVDSVNTTELSLEDTVNFHSVRVSVGIEPVSSTANAKGVVVLYKREAGETAIVPTIANLNNELDVSQIWAIEFWAASNETPIVVRLSPKTSRNIGKNGFVGVAVSAHGITAGSVSYSVLLTGHERQI